MAAARPRLLALERVDTTLLERFLAEAERRGAYDRRDAEPCDISILPRVVSRAEAARLSDLSVRAVRAALDWAVARSGSGDRRPGYGLDWVATMVDRLPDELMGNVRLDFLVAGGVPWLLEMGWVNLSGFDYAPQAGLALLDVVPSLRRDFVVHRPVAALRRRLLERGVRRLAILVKEDHTPYAANDFQLIGDAVRPIETIVVAEPDYGTIERVGRRLHVAGDVVDAVYLRALDGPAAFSGKHAATNLHTLRSLLASDVVFHDHPLMLLAEDKDLRFLVSGDPALAACIPAIRHPDDVEPAAAADWVLKLRDRHSGTGVFFDGPSMRDHWADAGAILQQRLVADPVEVRTVHGRHGQAVADLAVHVSYRYDVTRRELRTAEVAGYFSRFTLDGCLVNLCAGGGILPVLSERTSQETP